MTKKSVYAIAIASILCGVVSVVVCLNSNLFRLYLPSSFDQEISCEVFLYPVTEYIGRGSDVGVTIDNHSAFDFYYSPIFTLEKQKMGRWYKVPYKSSSVFTEESFCIAGGEQAPHTFHIVSRFSKLSQGKYRIIQEGILYDGNGDSHGKQYLIVEFFITKDGLE